MIRALLSWLVVLPVLYVGADLGQLLRPAPHAEAACCCGPHGVENGCTCTGPCCAHTAEASATGPGPWFDDHCGERSAAPAAPTSLLPGTPVAVRLAHAPGASRPAARPGDPLHASPSFAPPEPPPRAAVR